MTNNDDKKWLYDKFSKQGLNIGSYEDFENSLLNNEEDRRWYHSKAQGMGLNVGDYDSFNNLFGVPQQGQPQQPASPVPQQGGAEQQPQQPQQQPEKKPFWYNVADSLSRSESSPQGTGAPQQTTPEPEPERTEAQQQTDKSVEAGLNTIDGEINDMYRQIMDEGQKIQKEFEKKHPIMNAMLNAHGKGDLFTNQQDMTLNAAMRLSNDGRKLMEAAVNGGGVVKGLGDSVLDFSTWDGGLSDTNVAMQAKAVASKLEKGTPLNKQEELLLDALATNAFIKEYYSGDLGRMYKAGQVTGESLPFMLEFIVNPLAGGEQAASGGAIKALQKKVASLIEKKAMKEGVQLALKGAARMGDDVLSAGGMAMTSGAVRTAGDAFQRMSSSRRRRTESSSTAWTAVLTLSSALSLRHTEPGLSRTSPRCSATTSGPSARLLARWPAVWRLPTWARNSALVRSRTSSTTSARLNGWRP